MTVGARRSRSAGVRCCRGRRGAGSARPPRRVRRRPAARRPRRPRARPGLRGSWLTVVRSTCASRERVLSSYPTTESCCGYGDPGPPYRVQEPDGAPVVRGDHGGRAGGSPPSSSAAARAPAASVWSPATTRTAVLEAVAAHRHAVAASPVGGDRALAPVDEGDVAVAQPGQVLDGQGDAPVVGRADHVDRRRTSAAGPRRPPAAARPGRPAGAGGDPARAGSARRSGSPAASRRRVARPGSGSACSGRGRTRAPRRRRAGPRPARRGSCCARPCSTPSRCRRRRASRLAVRSGR